MSSESPPHVEEEPRCACMEKEYIQSLNKRFASYVSRVRQLRSLSGSGAGESSSLYSVSLANTSTVKIQENQITALKTMYERQLEELRTKLGEITRDRTQLQLATTKNTGLITELQTRLEKEANIRKKLEEALKDAQRAIADKEALLQDARNEAAQRENAHIETKQDRDGLLATLTRTQQTLEVEMAAKDELQNLANELKEKFHFQQQLSEKELSEMRCSLDEANKSIELIERRTHEEYDSSEEKISAMLAKIKNRHEMEFQKFKEESEAAYENGLQNCSITIITAGKAD